MALGENVCGEARARLRKILLLQTYLTPRDADTRWFVIGSYLLVKGSRTYINMFTKNSLEWYPQYLARLGAYLHRPRSKLGDYWYPKWRVYRRRFRNGMVVVNPSNHAVTLPSTRPWRVAVGKGGGAVGPNGKRPGTYTYKLSKNVTVPAYSARVLRRRTGM